jgi:trimethylamine:corrinoid methyltransferase-like protein
MRGRRSHSRSRCRSRRRRRITNPSSDTRKLAVYSSVPSLESLYLRSVEDVDRYAQVVLRYVGFHVKATCGA